MSEVPACLTVLLSELSDAIVPSIVRISVLVHISNGREVPHSDATFTSSSENDPLVLRMTSRNSEEWPSVTSKSHIWLSVDFETLQAP